MSANDPIPPTREEAQAILSKYGFWVDPRFLKRRPELEKEVLRFCDAHLNAEYRDVALRLLQSIEDEEPEAFGRGDAKIWAAGFWHALGSINFLFDPDAEPYVKVGQIAEFYEVKPGSMTQRSTALREAMGLDHLDTRFATAAHKERTEQMHAMMAQAITQIAPGTTIEEALAGMPNWGKRRSSRHEFVDRDRHVMSDYYELMQMAEQLPFTQTAARLKKLIERDPDFFDSYLALGEMMDSIGKSAEAEAILDEAYNRAVRLICDKKGNWPQHLEWGWLENRHILRTLSQRGFNWWQDGKKTEALELFRKIFKVCPGDNMGLRYLILALNQGLTLHAFERKFKSQTVMDKWFEREAPKYPDDFGAFLEEMKRWIGG